MDPAALENMMGGGGAPAKPEKSKPKGGDGMLGSIEGAIVGMVEDVVGIFNPFKWFKIF